VKSRRRSRGSVIVVCPDTHVPFHDPLAWRTFLKAVRVVEPDHFVFIGDFADFWSVSFYAKSPDRCKMLKPEIVAVNRELDKVSALQRSGHIGRVTFVAGNHEYRLARYLTEKAPELFGLVDLQQLFRFRSRGWDYVPYGQSLTIGKMDLTHDVGRCGKNAAQTSLEDYGSNLAIGHTHRLSTVYAGTVQGDKRVCLNVGWLGGFEHIDYKHKSMALRSYQHGFGLIHQDSDGFSSCHAIPIHAGRCEVNGKWVTA
jgi:hypothetical protein